MAFESHGIRTTGVKSLDPAFAGIPVRMAWVLAIGAPLAPGYDSVSSPNPAFANPDSRFPALTNPGFQQPNGWSSRIPNPGSYAESQLLVLIATLARMRAPENSMGMLMASPRRSQAHAAAKSGTR